MDKKVKLILGLIIAFGGGLIILALGLCYDLLPFNPYSASFWMIFVVLVVYFALGAKLKNIPGMIVSYACGLGWGFISCMSAYLWQQSNHLLFAVLNYFLIASLMVFLHQFVAEGTVFGFAPCAFLGLAESIFAATCSIPDSHGQLMTPNTWNAIDLFIIFMIGILMVTLLSLFTGFLAKLYMKNKMPQGGKEDAQM